MTISLPWSRKEQERVEPLVEVDANLLFETTETEMEASFETEAQQESEWIWRPLFILTLAGVALALWFTGVREYVNWIDRQIGFVIVDGATRHIDTNAVEQGLWREINAPLLDLDLQRLHETLVSQPWINEASIKRSWPAAIEVELIEEVPVARWGGRGLLNHEGDIFWPELKPEYESLPQLSGPSHETVRIMQQYHDLSQLFSRSQMRILGLRLEPRGAWDIELDNGIHIIAGREELMPRLRRFLDVYAAQLAYRAAEVAEVDIRYTNGVAVRWKEDAGPTKGNVNSEG